MLTRLSSPPVIYRDLIMEKLHFPDTRVVRGLVIPTTQMLPSPEVVVNPRRVCRSGGSRRPPQPGEAAPCVCIGP